MKQRVVITGVAGFIGSNLAERLIAGGNQVIGIDNLAYGVREQIPPGVDFHQVDIRSNDLVGIFDSADHVFHLAAKNCIADCQQDPVDTASINVMGTVNVFEAARQAKVKKVIYAESSALYEGSSVLPTPEWDVHPESMYAISKASSMMFAEAYHRFFGVRSTALRYFCVYGPRQDYRRTIPPVFSAFIIKLLRGEQPVIYGTGEKRRDFIHVDDVNDFHLLCMSDERTTGKVFNIGSGTNFSINEIAKIVQDLLGSKIEMRHEPDMPGEAMTTLADNREATSLGWAPKINLHDGLMSSIRFIKRELEEGRI
jgi:UDP-glucose 4-epimerase